MLFNLLLILILIIANGVFSGSETALITSKKVRLEQLAKHGNKSAKLALKLAKHPNKFLSTVQVGITLIGILTGAVGGATLSQSLQVLIEKIAFLKPYSEPLSFGIVVAFITYLSLVIGELVPKRLALNFPEKMACAVASPMNFLSNMTTPIVSILSYSTEGLLKVLGVKPSDEPPITEEEIKVLIEQGTEAGMFEEAEQEIVSRVFKLGDRTVKNVMTPRTSIIWLDLEEPLENTQQDILASNYSRFPVGAESLDNCLGILRIKDYLNAIFSQKEINLKELLQQPLFVTENTKALKVIEMFRETGIHLALVTDEYGGIEGLVTLNDLVVAMVGNLPEDDEKNEPLVIQREDGSWLLDGLLSIDELKDVLEIETLPDEEEATYQTLCGLVIHFLEGIPISGQHFEIENLRFEVMDMDGIRVDKVLVSYLQKDTNHQTNH
jgi:putative hemolysin